MKLIRETRTRAAIVAAAIQLAAVAMPLAAAAQATATRADAQVVVPVTAIDSTVLLRDISILAHDSMEGRRVGTPGSAKARAFLERRFREIGLEPAAGESFLIPFTFARRNASDSTRGYNIVGRIDGSDPAARVIVVTAHYDHLGVRDGEIFNGADDNASGTAAVLQIAQYFRRNTPRHTMIFALFDAEEGGLRGARAFVADPPVPLERIAVNVNLDMVGRNDAGELYVTGTQDYPALLPVVQRIAARAEVKLIPGHDSPTPNRSDDWTSASDHGAFHAQGIPFLYFGVEDHPDYHKESDEFAGIQPGFYAKAVRTVLSVVRALDGGPS